MGERVPCAVFYISEKVHSGKASFIKRDDVIDDAVGFFVFQRVSENSAIYII